MSEAKIIGRPFLPGQSGNPSGRSKGAGILRDQAEPYVPEAIERLIQTMRETKKDAVRLACIKEVFDRFAGKAITPSEVDISVLFSRKLSEMSIDELREFGKRYSEAIGSDPKLIEAAAQVPTALGESHDDSDNSDD